MIAPRAGRIPFSVACYDVQAFAVNLEGICKRDDSTLQNWRLLAFEKIQTAYQALKNAYDQKVAQAGATAGIAIQGQNPALNRVVERTELKKLCITMMTGQHLAYPEAMTDPSDAPAHHPEVDVLKALHEGPIAQFFEQAFEWEQMTYLFYPYFWGRKDNWVERARVTPDPDPLFDHFLTAGACRVLVPVPLAYVPAVTYLLQNGDKDLNQRVWRGGEGPTLGSDLYISIADETRNQTDDLAGATPDPDIPPWEYTLPTTLVWLQPDSTLPTFN